MMLMMMLTLINRIKRSELQETDINEWRLALPSPSRLLSRLLWQKLVRVALSFPVSIAVYLPVFLYTFVVLNQFSRLWTSPVPPFPAAANAIPASHSEFLIQWNMKGLIAFTVSVFFYCAFETESYRWFSALRLASYIWARNSIRGYINMQLKFDCFCQRAVSCNSHAGDERRIKVLANQMRLMEWDQPYSQSIIPRKIMN